MVWVGAAPPPGLIAQVFFDFPSRTRMEGSWNLAWPESLRKTKNTSYNLYSLSESECPIQTIAPETKSEAHLWANCVFCPAFLDSLSVPTQIAVPMKDVS